MSGTSTIGLRALVCSTLLLVAGGSLALGETKAKHTARGYSIESSDKACAAAAKSFKQTASLHGWKVVTRGNIGCDCKDVDGGGWRCSLTAEVLKPEDDDSGYRN